MFLQIRPGTASLNQGRPGSDEWKLSPKTVILYEILADYPSSHNNRIFRGGVIPLIIPNVP